MAWWIFSIRSIGGLEWMLERGMDSGQEGLLHETFSVELTSELIPVHVMIFNPSWVELIKGVD
jgi:hypothetical protein